MRLFDQASDLEDAGKIAAAVELYTASATLGNAIAQSNLGNLLDDAISPARPAEAVYWYKRAVKSGHITAAWNLAMHYRNLGQRRWHLHWLKTAAGMGDDDAAAELRAQKKRNGRKRNSATG
jgi:TPR repeat protein